MADDEPINYTKSTPRFRPNNLPPPPPLLLQRTPNSGQSTAPISSFPLHQSSHLGNNGTSNNGSDKSHQQTAEDISVVQKEPNVREKYSQLLSMVGDMSKDLKQAYTGSKASNERLKRSVNQAKILVRDLINESERRSFE